MNTCFKFSLLKIVQSRYRDQVIKLRSTDLLPIFAIKSEFFFVIMRSAHCDLYVFHIVHMSYETLIEFIVLQSEQTIAQNSAFFYI